MKIDVLYPVVARKAWAGFSLAVVAGLVLSACAAIPATEHHDDGKVFKNTAPAQATLANKAEVAVTPPSLKVAKTLDSAEAQGKAPIEQEPDPASNVFFSLGSAAITYEARATIQNIAGRLKENRRETVVLVGGTDGLGSREFCIAFSSKRADAVEAELLKFGVNASQIRKRPTGCENGSRQACHSEACRHKRRRVEIKFLE